MVQSTYRRFPPFPPQFGFHLRWTSVPKLLYPSLRNICCIQRTVCSFRAGPEQSRAVWCVLGPSFWRQKGNQDVLLHIHPCSHRKWSSWVDEKSLGPFTAPFRTWGTLSIPILFQTHFLYIILPDSDLLKTVLKVHLEKTCTSPKRSNVSSVRYVGELSRFLMSLTAW